MDIQSLSPSDGHQRDRKAVQFLEKLLTRNGNSEFVAGIANDVENLQHLMKNVRDAKNFHKIMEKFKLNADNLIDENFKDGEQNRYFLFVVNI